MLRERSAPGTAYNASEHDRLETTRMVILKGILSWIDQTDNRLIYRAHGLENDACADHSRGIRKSLPLASSRKEKHPVIALVTFSLRLLISLPFPYRPLDCRWNKPILRIHVSLNKTSESNSQNIRFHSRTLTDFCGHCS